MATQSISIINAGGSGSNIAIFQRPPQSGGIADIAWRATTPTPPASTDWTSAYAGLDKIGGGPSAGNEVPSTNGQAGADAYDASGKGQTWNVTTGKALYL